MSFWDSYKDEGGGKYLSASEKAALIDNAVTLEIVGVRRDDKNQFKGEIKPRFLVTFLVPNPLTGEAEERLAGFAINTEDASSRDRLLDALVPYLQDEDHEPVEVVLELIGNFVSIRKAD